MKKSLNLSVNNGVEITSWKINNQEIIYQKNGTWNKQDPFLFPNIGKSYQNWNVNNNSVSLPKHGIFINTDKVFEKKSKFNYTYVNKAKNSIFEHNFTCSKQYKLESNKLKISAKIQNDEIVSMPYQVGFHLAIRIDSNAKIYFEKNSYQINLVDLNSGQVTDEVKTISLGKKWNIDYDIFKKYDSLIFNNKQINSLIIENKTYYLKFDFLNNFNALCLWTNSNHSDENKFLCCEPWSNLPTTKHNLNQRELRAKESVIFKYKITYIKK